MSPRTNRKSPEPDLTGLEQTLDAADGDDLDDDGALEDAAALEDDPAEWELLESVQAAAAREAEAQALADAADAAHPRVRPEDVVVQLIPIDSISQHPDNNNRGDKEAIGDSIKELGFFDPIIVQKSTGYIISGNHSWEVYRSRGAEQIPALVYDVDDLTAKRMLLAANRTGRLGHDDEEATFKLLKSLEEEAGTPYVLAGTGWHLDDYETLAAQFNALPVLPPAAPELIQAHYAETPEQETARAELIAGYQPRGGNVQGLREVILVLPLDVHADLMADVAALRRLLPGDYTTGALIAAIIADAAASAPAPDADPGDWAHPSRCPCFRCQPPEPLEEPMIPRQGATP